MNYLEKQHKDWLNLDSYIYNMYVCDFETITQNTEWYKKHNSTGIVYGHFKSMDGSVESSFNNIEDMFKDLVEVNRGNKIRVFFHNLSFDGVFILDWLGRNGFTLDNALPRNKTFTVFRTTGSKIFNIRVRYLNKNFEFCCSKLLLTASVKALGKCVNIDKYVSEAQETEEFYNVEPEYNLEVFELKNRDYCLYCQRDVEIVRLSLIGFFTSLKQFLEDFGGGSYTKKVMEGTTISQISLALQLMCAERSGVSSNDLFLHHKVEREIMDKFTNGGLTISNEAYRTKELKDLEGYVIDLKSAYPAVMSGKIPYGEMLFTRPTEGDYCEFLEVYYTCLRPKNHKIPLLKNWNDKSINAPNYYLEADNYTTYLLKEEMELIEQLYDFTGKMVLKRYFFRLKDYLTDFVSYGFKMKEFHKKEGRAASSHTFKILLNSAYGIHAKRTDFKSVCQWKGENWSDKKKKYELSEIDLNREDRHSYIPNNKLYAYDFIDYVNDQSFISSHKGIANYVTAMTRCKLLRGILHFKPENFLYCDTDSLFLMNVSEDEIRDYCGNQLGDWELEDKKFDTAIVMRSKNYQLYKDNEIVKSGSAGIKKNALDLRQERMKTVVEILAAALIPQRVKGGLILVPVNKVLNFGRKQSLSYCGKVLKESWERYNDTEKLY